MAPNFSATEVDWVLPPGGATLGQATPLAGGDGGTQDGEQVQKPEWEGLASPTFASERGWRNWTTSFAGHLFSTLAAKFQFQPLPPPSHNTSTCPALGAGEAVGGGGSQQVCCPWQPAALCPCLQLIAANAASHDEAGGKRWTLCLQVVYLFCSPATLHLFRCSAGVYAGRRFLAVSASQKTFVVLGFFFFSFWKVVVLLLISFFYGQSLWVHH